jgi:hypothetical protein
MSIFRMCIGICDQKLEIAGMETFALQNKAKQRKQKCKQFTTLDKPKDRKYVWSLTVALARLTITEAAMLQL